MAGHITVHSPCGRFALTAEGTGTDGLAVTATDKAAGATFATTIDAALTHEVTRDSGCGERTLDAFVGMIRAALVGSSSAVSYDVQTAAEAGAEGSDDDGTHVFLCVHYTVDFTDALIPVPLTRTAASPGASKPPISPVATSADAPQQRSAPTHDDSQTRLIAQLRTQVATLQSQLTERDAALATLTAEHAAMRTLSEQQLAEMRATCDDLVERFKPTAPGQLRAQLAKAKQEAAWAREELRKVEVENGRLQRQLRSQRSGSTPTSRGNTPPRSPSYRTSPAPSARSGSREASARHTYGPPPSPHQQRRRSPAPAPSGRTVSPFDQRGRDTTPRTAPRRNRFDTPERHDSRRASPSTQPRRATTNRFDDPRGGFTSPSKPSHYRSSSGGSDGGRYHHGQQRRQPAGWDAASYSSGGSSHVDALRNYPMRGRAAASWR